MIRNIFRAHGGILALASAISLFAVSAPFAVHGATVRGGEEYVLEKDTSLQGDLYAAGNEVSIHGSVDGDVLAAASKVMLSGSIQGDVAGAGGQVIAGGIIEGDVRLAGGEVVLTGTTTEDAIIAGGTVIIGDEAVVTGDLIVFAERLLVRGTVLGSLTARVSSLEIDGTVNGKVAATVGESVTVRDHAELKGGFSYRAPRTAFVTSGARIANPTEYTESPTAGAAGFSFSFVGAMVRFLITLVGAALLLLCARTFALETVERAVNRTVPVLGWGLVALIGMPIVGVILCVTLLGLLPGAFMLLSWFLILILAKALTPIFAGYLLSWWLQKTRGATYAWVAVGAVCLTFLTALPFFGYLVTFLLFVLCVGSLGLGLYERFFRKCEQNISKAPKKSDNHDTSQPT